MSVMVKKTQQHIITQPICKVFSMKAQDCLIYRPYKSYIKNFIDLFSRITFKAYFQGLITVI